MARKKHSLEEQKTSHELHEFFFTDFIDWQTDKDFLEVPNFEKKLYQIRYKKSTQQ